MRRFKVCPVIRHVRNTEGGLFLMLRLEVCPEIIFRTTDGGPFLMLRFKIHAFSNVCKNYRGWTNSYTWFKIHPEFLFWNLILFFILYHLISSHTAFSDPLKNFIKVLQRVGHFLYCALRTDRIFILELCREDGSFLNHRWRTIPYIAF